MCLVGNGEWYYRLSCNIRIVLTRMYIHTEQPIQCQSLLYSVLIREQSTTAEWTDNCWRKGRLTDFTSFFECDGFQPFLKTSFYGCESTDPCSNHSYRLSGHYVHLYITFCDHVCCKVCDASRRIRFVWFPKMSNFVFFLSTQDNSVAKSHGQCSSIQCTCRKCPPKKKKKKRPIKFDYRLMGKPQKSSSCYYAPAHI